MNKNALIVDDCEFTKKYLTRCLTELGFHVDSATSGEDAIQKIQNSCAPDVILIDWVMPGMPGPELVSWLRSQQGFQSTPILMVTAQKELSNISEALSKGADEYVMKPFSKESIAEKLKLLGVTPTR
jgi:two-component system chemotaxis response regulator CheY